MNTILVISDPFILSIHVKCAPHAAERTNVKDSSTAARRGCRAGYHESAPLHAALSVTESRVLLDALACTGFGGSWQAPQRDVDPGRDESE